MDWGIAMNNHRRSTIFFSNYLTISLLVLSSPNSMHTSVVKSIALFYFA